MLKKKFFFKTCFGTIWAKPTIFYENLKNHQLFKKKIIIKFGLFETAFGQMLPSKFLNLATLC